MILLVTLTLSPTSTHPLGRTQMQHPPRQRLSCAPGMFNSLEVQVLYPT